MTKDEALRRLTELKPWLASQGVTRLRLFGSTARDEARADSDVDLLVDFDPMPGLRFFALEREIGARLGAEVELSMEGGLNPIVKSRVLAEAVDVI